MLKNCVRAVRKEKGMTQKELANTAEINQGLLCDIEHEKRSDMKASTMKKIADALGEYPFDLFYWDDLEIY